MQNGNTRNDNPSAHPKRGHPPNPTNPAERAKYLEDAFAHATVGLVITNLEGHIVESNPAFQAIVGSPADELLLQPLTRFLPFPDLDHIEGQEKRTLLQMLLTRPRALQKREECILHPGGHEVWVRFHCSLSYDEQRNPHVIVVTVEDISQERRAHNALFESQQLLRRVIDTIPHAVFLKDEAFTYKLCNRRFANLAGFDEPEGVIDKNDYELPWKKEHADFFRMKDVQIQATKRTETYIEPVQFVDKREAWIEIVKSPIYNQDGRFIGILGTFEEVTERLKAEEELRQSKAFLQGFLDHSPNIIFAKDLAGRYIMTNRRFEEFFGVEHSAMIGKTDKELFPEPFAHMVQTYDQEVLLRQETIDIEDIVPHRNGPYTFLTTKYPIYDNDGRIYALGGIKKDITERKKGEEEQQRLAAIVENSSDFIGLASLDGTTEYINEAGRKMVGISPDEDVSKYPVNAFFPTEQVPYLQHHIIPFAEKYGSWAGEFRMLHQKSGKEIPIYYNHFVVCNRQTGDPIALATVSRDLTAQKKAEQKHRNLISLIENSPDFIGLATLEGLPLYLNRAGRTMVGIADEDYHNKSVKDYFFPEEGQKVMNKVLPEVIEKGRWEGETHLRHFQTGEAIPVHARLFTIKDVDMSLPIGIASITRDVSDQLRIQQEHEALQGQIIEAQRSVIRELSTPLMPFFEGVVAMPLVGSMDSARAQQVMDTLLEGIAQYNAQVAILDITGIPTIDTQVADALVQAARAAKLLGAQVIITGIGPQMAQTFVHLGAHLDDIITYNSLERSISHAMKLLHLCQ